MFKAFIVTINKYRKDKDFMEYWTVKIIGTLVVSLVIMAFANFSSAIPLGWQWFVSIMVSLALIEVVTYFDNTNYHQIYNDVFVRLKKAKKTWIEILNDEISKKIIEQHVASLLSWIEQVLSYSNVIRRQHIDPDKEFEKLVVSFNNFLLFERNELPEFFAQILENELDYFYGKIYHILCNNRYMVRRRRLLITEAIVDLLRDTFTAYSTSTTNKV